MNYWPISASGSVVGGASKQPCQVDFHGWLFANSGGVAYQVDFYTVLSTTSGASPPLPATSNATLTTALVSATAYTSLAVSPLAVAINPGDSVILVSGANTQTFVASAAAAVGATTIAVNSLAANFSYPIGTFVDQRQLVFSILVAATSSKEYFEDGGVTFKNGLFVVPSNAAVTGSVIYS